MASQRGSCRLEDFGQCPAMWSGWPKAGGGYRFFRTVTQAQSEGSLKMDDIDRHNLLVLSVFGAAFLAFIVGYVVAWRSKRAAYRVIGSFMVAVSVGLFGLFALAWFISMPPLLILLPLALVPLGLLYVSV